MDPFTIAASAVSIGSNLLGGSSANKAARRAARQQARLVGAQRKEEMLREQLAYRQTRGQAVAGIAAGNLQMSGSAKRYLTAMDSEANRQRMFKQEAMRAERRAILKGAEGVKRPYQYAALGDSLSLLARAFKPGDSTGGR
jgi:hypothetical protein